ncbi:hypothetical protein GQ43DRAFT_442141 [Delitschia confertaspora ATCC 74209]|uniref:RRM domain-containing protein n=1 Tax=Delitschia confertaspora ATCC 74209 TaxID=1513339 RepID=A0A9P4JIM6_9PLEO|nr:hypothetical protein GQ43DRAFT_442141 [Delitschia confertaspora ATCC 74209]
MASTTKANPPNQTLFLRNLPTTGQKHMKKEDLRRNLYMLFTTYGAVLDVVHMRAPTLRNTAHIVFRDVETSTRAMRALQGFEFFGQELVISYAKGKSDIIAKLDGTFKIPTKEVPMEHQAEMTDLQRQVFGGGAPAAPKAAAPVAAEPEAKNGVKRPREEESEPEDDEDAAMDVSDSD